jgi:hypothetical protein
MYVLGSNYEVWEFLDFFFSRFDIKIYPTFKIRDEPKNQKLKKIKKIRNDHPYPRLYNPFFW